LKLVGAKGATMELLSILGQYLLLSFVLPGFCYVAALLFWVPQKFYDPLKANWLMTGVIGGLLLSSVAFGLEITLRFLCVTIDCEWFPRIPFETIRNMGSVVNFFAGETFMHLDIGLGLLVILVVFLIHTTVSRGWNKQCGIFKIWPTYFALALFVLVAANIMVSSYLFHRVNDIAYNKRDAVDRDDVEGSANYCKCIRESRTKLERAECQKPIALMRIETL
jgi:hypothetical protein